MKNKFNTVRAVLFSGILILSAFYANAACSAQGAVLCQKEAVPSGGSEDTMSLPLAGSFLFGQGKTVCCLDRACMSDRMLVLGPNTSGFSTPVFGAVFVQVFQDKAGPASARRKALCPVPIYTLVQAFLC